MGERESWKRSHVVLVVTGQPGCRRPLVEYVGHAKSVRRAGTLIKTIKVSQLHRVAPAHPHRDALRPPPPRHRRAAQADTGQLTKRAGEELVDALTRADPTDVVARLQAQTEVLRTCS